MELLDMAAVHLVYVVYASDGISTGGLFHWSKDKGPDRAYSLEATDCPRLPQFSWKGPAGSTALLNLIFWMVLDSLSTWRVVSQLYCNVDDMGHMADLADSVYNASSAALGTVCPALSAGPKISKNLVAYLAGLIVVTPYAAGWANNAQQALLRHTSTSF